jgi:hypothetical protein
MFKWLVEFRIKRAKEKLKFQIQETKEKLEGLRGRRYVLEAVCRSNHQHSDTKDLVNTCGEIQRLECRLTYLESKK